MEESDGEAAQGPECLNDRQDRSVPVWLHVPGWQARVTPGGDTAQVLLSSRTGADHSPRLTSVHSLGHQISQGNKSDGVGRMGGRGGVQGRSDCGARGWSSEKSQPGARQQGLRCADRSGGHRRV